MVTVAFAVAFASVPIFELVAVFALANGLKAAGLRTPPGIGRGASDIVGDIEDPDTPASCPACTTIQRVNQNKQKGYERIVCVNKQDRIKSMSTCS